MNIKMKLIGLWAMATVSLGANAALNESKPVALTEAQMEATTAGHGIHHKPIYGKYYWKGKWRVGWHISYPPGRYKKDVPYKFKKVSKR